MSAREQARRDAEFDRLLAELGRDHIGDFSNEIATSLSGRLLSWERDAIEKMCEMLIKKAASAGHELGKRHGRSELLGELERERHIAMEEA